MPSGGKRLPSDGMDTTTATQPQTIPAVVIPGLAVEVVDALYPQWAVNGHDIPAAFETIAERHADPVIRETAQTTPLAAVLVAALEVVFWQRARAERQAQSVR